MKSQYYKIGLCLFLILIFTVVYSSISFSYQNGFLDINGNASVNKNSWNIYFKELKVINSGETDKIDIDNKTTKIDLDLTLKDNEYIEFSFDIFNDSLYDLKLSGITLINMDKEVGNNLSFRYTYMNGEEVNVNDTINSGDLKKVKVSVRNSGNINIYNLRFSIRFGYVQEN